MGMFHWSIAMLVYQRVSLKKVVVFVFPPNFFDASNGVGVLEFQIHLIVRKLAIEPTSVAQSREHSTGIWGGTWSCNSISTTHGWVKQGSLNSPSRMDQTMQMMISHFE